MVVQLCLEQGFSTCKQLFAPPEPTPAVLKSIKNCCSEIYAEYHLLKRLIILIERSHNLQERG